MAETHCACPRVNPHDCVRVRYGHDLREAIDADYETPSEEPCECSCHDDWWQDEDSEEEW